MSSSDTVMVPRAWLTLFDRENDPLEAIADDGSTAWDMFCHEAKRYAASPQQSPISGEGAIVSPDELLDAIDVAISDSLDVDWRTMDGAREVAKLFTAYGWTVIESPTRDEQSSASEGVG